MSERAGNDAQEMVVLDAVGRWYGVPAQAVSEVVRMAALAPLPGAPDWVAGILTIRGAVVPVIDLRGRLGLNTRPPELSDRIAVVDAPRGRIGLLADGADLVMAEPHDGAAAEQAVGTSLVRRTAWHAERLVLVLNLEELDKGLDQLTAGDTVAGAGHDVE